MLFVCTCTSGQFEGITITHVFGQNFEDNLCISRAVSKRQGPGISAQLLSKEIKSNYIEPKETPSCLFPHLLVVFTRHLEILVTAPVSVTIQHLN